MEASRWTRSAMRVEPVAAVPGGVQTGDVGEQHLRRADVRRRLLAADVLLAGLQRQTQRGPALGVGADPDDAPGHRPRRRLAGGDERGVRAAEPHRHAESLSRTDGDVGTELARGSGQHARQQIRDDHGDTAELVDPGDGVGPVDHCARRGRQAEQRAEAAVGLGRRSRSSTPPMTSSMPTGSALVCSTASSADACRGGRRSGWSRPWTRRRAIVIASAAAVASSSSEALATSRPVSSVINVWKFRRPRGDPG